MQVELLGALLALHAVAQSAQPLTTLVNTILLAETRPQNSLLDIYHIDTVCNCA